MGQLHATLLEYADEAHEPVASPPDVPARVALHSVAHDIVARDS